MTRRPRTHALATLPSLVAAAALLVAAPAPGSASTILRFRLTNEGNRPVSKVDFRVLPPGAVVPPVVGTDPETGAPLTGSPVTLMPGSTGFDATRYSVALGSGNGQQGLRMLFGQTQTVGADGRVSYEQALDSDGQPVGLFMPGAVLHFALNVDTDVQDVVRLQLPDAATGLTLKSFANEPDEPGQGGGTVEPPPITQVPEPATLALWASAVGLLLARARSRRRAGRTA